MHNDENTWLARLADRHEVGSAHLMIDIDLDGVCSDYVEGLRQFVASRDSGGKFTEHLAKFT